METIKVNTKLTFDEKEVILTFDNTDRVWIMDSTVPKYFRKALKQGWNPVKQYVDEDGMVCGMVLTAPERAITIRSTTKKQMSDKQLENLNKSDDNTK